MRSGILTGGLSILGLTLFLGISQATGGTLKAHGITFSPFDRETGAFQLLNRLPVTHIGPRYVKAFASPTFPDEKYLVETGLVILDNDPTQINIFFKLPDTLQAMLVQEFYDHIDFITKSRLGGEWGVYNDRVKSLRGGAELRRTLELLIAIGILGEAPISDGSIEIANIKLRRIYRQYLDKESFLGKLTVTHVGLASSLTFRSPIDPTLQFDFRTQLICFNNDIARISLLIDLPPDLPKPIVDDFYAEVSSLGAGPPGWRNSKIFGPRIGQAGPSEFILRALQLGLVWIEAVPAPGVVSKSCVERVVRATLPGEAEATR